MCGIAGQLNWERSGNQATVRAMNQAQAHRGPDGTGVIQDGPVVFGHQRLAIIDLSEAGKQPMYDISSEVLITFNGEIYNYKELRAELKSSGAVFRSATDTEVMLEGYKRWGVSFITRLNGMFALALWDRKSNTLILARDRLGKKPLFYFEHKEGLSFASELQALLCDPLIPDALNSRAVLQYLFQGYILGSECVNPSVKKLPPASILIVQQGKSPKLESYWDLASSFLNKREFSHEQEAADELLDILNDATRIRLMSDVPLGAFLSGGIDSSAVVALLAKLKGRELTYTFSTGFPEKSFDEREEARYVANHLGTKHSDQAITEKVSYDFQRIASLAGEPFADNSIVAMYYLAAFTRRHVTVALSGDGADEIFAGYETYIADKLRHYVQFLPKFLVSGMRSTYEKLSRRDFGKVSWDYKLVQFLQGCSQPFVEAHCSWRRFFTPAALRQILQPEHLSLVQEADPVHEFNRFNRHVAGATILDRASYIDIKTWLADDILVKVDRSTMAHSLEARAPFLDYRMVEFAASLPVRYKLRGFCKKYLLKKALNRELPAKVLNRHKRGFNSPVSHWLLGSGGELIRSIAHRSPVHAYIKPEKVTELHQQHISRKADNSFRLFAILNLHFWLDSRKVALQKVA